MSVEEYIQIAKDIFPYLFERYQFKVVYLYQGQERDIGRYAFGMESDVFNMKILFSRQRGAGGIYFGPSSAPFANEDSNLWINEGNLLWYLQGQKVDWSELDKYKEEDRIRPAFQLISKILVQHCPQIFHMFSSVEAIAAWKPKYDEFINGIYMEYKRKYRNINL